MALTTTPIGHWKRSGLRNAAGTLALAGEIATQNLDESGSGNHAHFIDGQPNTRMLATENGFIADGETNRFQISAPIVVAEIYTAFRSLRPNFYKEGSSVLGQSTGDGNETFTFLPDTRIAYSAANSATYVSKNGVAIPDQFGYDLGIITEPMVLKIRTHNPTSSRYLQLMAGTGAQCFNGEHFETRAYSTQLSDEESAEVIALMMAEHIRPTVKTVPLSDPGIKHDPYVIYNGRAVTPAKWTIGFTGDICAFYVDVSDNAFYPTISLQVDGGPVQTRLLNSNDSRISVSTSAGDGPHVGIVRLEELPGGLIDKWNEPNCGLTITEFEIGIDEETVVPETLPKYLLVDADSIGQGVNSVAANQSLGRSTFAQYLAQALGAEVGVRGFGSLGITKIGGGNVPALLDSMDFSGKDQPLLVNGRLSPEPDYIVCTLGTNDAQSFGANVDVSDEIAEYITRRRAEAPNAKIFICTPPARYCAASLELGVTKAGDENAYFIDIEQSIMNSDTLSDAVHPNARGHALYAALLASKIQAALAPNGGGGDYPTPEEIAAAVVAAIPAFPSVPTKEEVAAQVGQLPALQLNLKGLERPNTASGTATYKNANGTTYATQTFGGDDDSTTLGAVQLT